MVIMKKHTVFLLSTSFLLAVCFVNQASASPQSCFDHYLQFWKDNHFLQKNNLTARVSAVSPGLYGYDIYPINTNPNTHRADQHGKAVGAAKDAMDTIKKAIQSCTCTVSDDAGNDDSYGISGLCSTLG